MLSHTQEWILDSQSSLAPLAKWQETVNLMANVFKAPAGFIVQFTNDGNCQVVIASDDDENPYDAGTIIDSNNVNLFCRKVVDECQPLYERHATANPEWNSNPEVTQDKFNSYLGYPVCWPDGTVFGTICVMNFAITDYDEVYIRLMSQFRDFIEADLQLREKFMNAEQLSYTDSLTQLYNRRGFIESSGRLLKLANRINSRLGLIFIDVDKLKDINDNYGHSVGDQVLRTVGETLSDVMRDTDIGARLGGDEFALLALANRQSELMSIRERIRQGLLQRSKNVEHEINITVSMGDVIYEADKELTVDAMISAADMRMYRDKARPAISAQDG